MSDTKPGDRVGALISYDPETKKCEFLGYGIYEGNLVIDDTACGDVAEMNRGMFDAAEKLLEEEGMLEEFREEFQEHIKNPRILLDNGDQVWGCECWWDSESNMKEKLKDAELVTVSISAVRNEWQRLEEERDTEGEGS